MARKYRKRTYRRKSGRWAPNITKITGSFSAPGGAEFYDNITLCSNPVQLNTTVSQAFTAKNFELSLTIEAVNPQQPSSSYAQYIDNVTCYIMYVPQGMTIGADYYQQHPEYIMTYKYLGSAQSVQQSAQPIRVKTRLSRKLQTGDQIILFINGISNDNNYTPSVKVDGIVRWWTKAN